MVFFFFFFLLLKTFFLIFSLHIIYNKEKKKKEKETKLKQNSTQCTKIAQSRGADCSVELRTAVESSLQTEYAHRDTLGSFAHHLKKNYLFFHIIML